VGYVKNQDGGNYGWAASSPKSSETTSW